MDVAAVKRLVNDVCLGLASLHAKGMLHRDIKPANILLDYRGKAKIGDFGLVTDDLLFGYADQAGYSDHLAFEVWHKGVTSAQSDIWALGMTMYRLLHGSAWYDASPLPRLEIHKGNFAGKLPWLPHISADWRRVIRKMMRDDTDYRYKTVAEVQKAIAPLMVQRPWSCTVSKNTISWELREAGRRKLVLLDRTNPKSCTWKAVSHPLSNGQSRRLAASKRPVAFNAALGELQRYFQGR